MQIQAYKTPLIKPNDDLLPILAAAIPTLPEKSVVVLASKIVGTAENRFVPKITGDRDEKHALAKREAEWYLDPHSSKYDLMLTIKRNWLFVNAGIDESNANEQYSLWPADPQKSVNHIWQFLRDHFGVKELGVTMSDSISMPLNWGVVGHAIAYCGFEPLKSYVGQPDLFNRPMKMEQVNVMQSVTTAAVLTMGEGNECTPLAVVSDIPAIVFQDHVPTEAELAALKIDIADDAYAPILTSAAWQKGEG